MESFWYASLPSAFGLLGLVWQESPAGPRVYRILLPNEWAPAGEAIWLPEGEVRPGSCPAMDELAGQMTRYLAGELVELPLDRVALEICSPFQQRVLRAEYAIPRGQVSTYGRIAAHLGVPDGARAVGNALASNPFPILIPCHRAVRSDGSLGGYRGGLAMKRALLALEGVEVSAAGKVAAERFYYSTGV